MDQTPRETMTFSLRDLLAHSNVGKVYVADKSVSATVGAYRSRNCDRVALPIEGVHQMHIPSRGETSLISPQRGEAVWMPLGSWVRPTLEMAAKTMTIMVFQDALQFHLVSHDGGVFDKSEAVLGYRLEHPIPAHIFNVIHILKSPGVPEPALPSLVNSLCHMVLGHVEEAAANGTGTDSPPKTRRLWKTMVAYLEERFSTDITRADLARAFGISPNHLSRLFREHSNASLIETLTELRLSHACEELTQTNLRIGEVALSAGFPDVNYFCRVFRKKFGCPPGQFRSRA